MAKKSLSVSQLSSYAANPQKFCLSKGKAYNGAAAEHGTRMHNKAGRMPFMVKLILLSLVVGALWITLK